MLGNTKLQRLILSSIWVATYILVIAGCARGPHIAPFSQGTGLLNSGEYNSAIPYLKEALLIKPDYADASYNLGLAYQRLGRQQEAIISYKETIRLNPNYSKAHNNLGKAYETLGRNNEASAEYKKALKLDPSGTVARNNLNLLDPSVPI
jgi:Flp pilus assembly protein TadD